MYELRIFGSILLIRSISHDFSDINGDLIKCNDSDKILKCSMKKVQISEFIKNNQISATHRSYTNLILGILANQ